MVATAVNILLVDDHPENLLALEAVLAPLGHSIITASSGHEALKHLLEEEFAVVLLDVRMPDMDGFEIATLMRERERLQATPIIFLTAVSSSKEELAQGYALGAVDYVIKPLDPDALRAKVSVFVELYQVRAAAQRRLQAQALTLRETNEALRREIEQHQQTEQALRASEERLRLLVEGMEDHAIALLDGAGHVLTWNSIATRITGYTADEILGSHIARFYPDDEPSSDKLTRDVAQGDELLQQRLARGESVPPGEAGQRQEPWSEGEPAASSRGAHHALDQAISAGVYRDESWHVHKQGHRFCGHVVISALSDGLGAPRGFVYVMRDVTQRRRAQEEQEHLYHVAKQAIHEREALFSMASHELKTPLTVLLGAAALLERKAQPGQPLSPKDYQTILTIQEQVRRLQKMIDVVLDTAQLERGVLTLNSGTVDLNSLVERVVAEVRPTLSRHILSYDPVGVPLPMIGDALRLEQVVQNLLSNAIKYSPAGGEIILRVRAEQDKVCLSVQDHGIGIPAEAKHRLFQRFSRLRNSQDGKIPGLGVGLYLVKEIVTLHGGTVGVESAEGLGSTFTVCLPR